MKKSVIVSILGLLLLSTVGVSHAVIIEQSYVGIVFEGEVSDDFSTRSVVGETLFINVSFDSEDVTNSYFDFYIENFIYGSFPSSFVWSAIHEFPGSHFTDEFNWDLEASNMTSYLNDGTSFYFGESNMGSEIHAQMEAVPEPGTMILFGLGILGFVGVRRSRAKSPIFQILEG